MNYAFIDTNPNLQIGIVEGERLVHWFEQNPQVVPEGSIYRGRVLKLFPATQTYLVKLAEDETGVLPFKEALRPLHEGEQVLVELRSQGTNGKDPRLTMGYSLQGKGLVLDPFSKGVRISKRILEEEKRRWLLELGREMLQDQEGAVIFRTQSTKMQKEELIQEFQSLLLCAEAIRMEEHFLPTPKLIYYKPLDVLKILEDWKWKIDRLIVNDNRVAEIIKKSKYSEIMFFDPSYSVLEDRAVQLGLKGRLQRELPLPCGGNILIEELQTLTVIDVNSGSFHSAPSKEIAAQIVNMEAVDEAFRQLALRRIGGIVIIDFIRMQQKGREGLEEIVFRKFHDYSLNGRLYGFTTAGLYELILRR
ncbi:MAG: ribonuclease E/G [Tissierellia bacterium]|nr:ribonuclease E/G [Tissierellia bacterium]